MILIRRKELVLVGITYYRLDYPSLLQEFYHHFEDTVPDIPRVHKFLGFWKDNIESTIKEVQVSYGSGNYRGSPFYAKI
jgi:uncharacterized protein Usg